jgi:Hydrolytic ATP binding site of dynein motor region
MWSSLCFSCACFIPIYILVQQSLLLLTDTNLHQCGCTQQALFHVLSIRFPFMFFLSNSLSFIFFLSGFLSCSPPHDRPSAVLPQALFRPVAMMIPDYQLVAEVMLFSEGFLEAPLLSRKMVLLYRLAEEQLSHQDHYNFGMRALKAVLLMAGQATCWTRVQMQAANARSALSPRKLHCIQYLVAFA